MGAKQDFLNKVRDIAKSTPRTFEEIKTSYPELFNKVYDFVKNNNSYSIEKKIHSNKKSIENYDGICDLINRIKKNDIFTVDDTALLDELIKLLAITNIGGHSNRVMHFRSGKQTTFNNKVMNVADLFNKIIESTSLNAFKKLNFPKEYTDYAHFVYIYAMVKNIQDPYNFPMYYPAHRRVFNYCFDIKYDDYDSYCRFIRQITGIPRNLYTDVYYGILQIIVFDKIKEENLINKSTAEKEDKRKWLSNEFFKFKNPDLFNFDDLFNMPEDSFDKPLISAAIKPKNQILYGPPGTGKTYNMVNFALSIINNNDPKDYDTDSKKERKVFENKFSELMKISFGNDGKYKRIYFVTFHQSYSYEDFVLGIAPDLSNEKLKFKRKKGIFYIACENALNNPDDNFVIVIDEINRANISRVFGELITLIEDDKRISKVQDKGMRLMLPNAPSPEDDLTEEWGFSRNFGVPENLYIIGTMNTADKSIAALDIALRRRFRFIPKYPDLSLVEDVKLKDVMAAINSKIIEPDGDFERGADFTLGHSYFMDKTFNDIFEIMNHSIIPLLLEYYMNDFNKVKELLNKCLKTVKLETFKNEFDGTLRIE
ncbi:McrB family protein [Lutimonas vermicola]|uniref:AAA family ATPase n=1 Tax=Lutimonas vermicola TaxID=414288 RepID=A0ABU9L0F2_9FLAO